MPQIPSAHRAALREKTLRDDPLCTVLSCLWVRCNRCDLEIKLSPKMKFDPIHWVTHRGRCLKRPRKSGRILEVETPEPPSDSDSRTPSLSPPSRKKTASSSSNNLDSTYAFPAQSPPTSPSPMSRSGPGTSRGQLPSLSAELSPSASTTHVIVYHQVGRIDSSQQRGTRVDRWTAHTCDLSKPMPRLDYPGSVVIVKGLPDARPGEDLDDRDAAIWLSLLRLSVS
ncbi:hypothetical protein BKA70DRAFT_1214310 [Coprinopsis sp. MPI-PUGE-AT-0042]|nr:hypothetical protein BKA70DRAFT_1214310 [Coprinopsis sp. MPI-PUGE-AT-0042]